MTPRTPLLCLAIIASVGGLEGCRRKPEPAPAPATTQPANTFEDQRRADSVAAATRAQHVADSLAAARAWDAASDGPAVQAELRQALSQVIYFDYDQDILRDDARAALDAKVPILLANMGVSLTITGHTDERGTSEYNLALGQRRAAQVKRYLESKGVGGDRITPQSLGDSQPASSGTDEASFQMNRRAEFVAGNATGTLTRPRS